MIKCNRFGYRLTRLACSVHSVNVLTGLLNIFLLTAMTAMTGSTESTSDAAMEMPLATDNRGDMPCVNRKEILACPARERVLDVQVHLYRRLRLGT